MDRVGLEGRSSILEAVAGARVCMLITGSVVVCGDGSTDVFGFGGVSGHLCRMMGRHHVFGIRVSPAYELHGC